MDSKSYTVDIRGAGKLFRKPHQYLFFTGGHGGNGGRGGEQGGGGGTGEGPTTNFKADTMNIVLNQQLDNGLRRLPVEAGWSGIHLHLGHERIQGSVDGVE
jgi:hypothetical protein